MESQETSHHPVGLDSDVQVESESGSAAEKQSQSQLLSVKQKKPRLATTRGLGNSGRGSSLEQFTPNNTPSKFRPSVGSTPLTENFQVIARKPPHKLLGISSLHRLQSPLVPQPQSKPISSIRVSVISPRVDSEPAGASTSLDWDNFDESPSYSGSYGPPLHQSLAVEECLKEIQGLSEGIQNIPFTKESRMSFTQQHDRSEWETDMVTENEKLKEMKEHIYEMMEDYNEADVVRGNVEMVNQELKEIANARAEFRTCIKEYKKKFGTVHPSNCAALEGYLDVVNQQLRDHAKNIWTKVANIKDNQAVNVLPPAPVSQPPASHGPTAGDLDYKKKLFRDQLLYLTEAASLPDTGSVEECWRDKSESEVCQAMKDLSTWQTSMGKLSSAFRDYEKLSKQL